MSEKTLENNELVSWSKHCHADPFGADIFEATFPSIYGTSVTVSTFPERKVLDVGGFLKNESQRNNYISCVDHYNNRRIYAIPNSKANAKLSLNCCFEGDSVDWDVNQAYFNDGKLVAIVSNMSLTNISKGQELITFKDKKSHNSMTLKDIYKNELDRVSREIIEYEGKENPITEMVKLLNADSPKGKGLHDSYRDAVREVLTI